MERAEEAKVVEAGEVVVEVERAQSAKVGGWGGGSGREGTGGGGGGCLTNIKYCPSWFS